MVQDPLLQENAFSNPMIHSFPDVCFFMAWGVRSDSDLFPVNFVLLLSVSILF